MRVYILITLLAFGHVFATFSDAHNKQEIGRTESIVKVNESNIVESEKEKDVYYVESELNSNTKVF